ncbi:MAG: ABC transporter permease subunit [Paracoccaceae bacterium]
MRHTTFDHFLLIVAALIMGGPMILLFLGATQPGGVQPTLPSSLADMVDGFQSNLGRLAAMNRDGNAVPSAAQMFRASVISAGGVAVVSCVVGFLAAFSMVFLLRRAALFWFSITLITLYFPIEARMLSTFDVTVRLGLANSFAGLVLPILPLAMATLIFRQHLRTLPPQLLEAARLDGAGPIRFLCDFAVPLSLVPIAAVFMISFLIGWNQYLWPLMISFDNSIFPLMRGLNLVGAGSGLSMVLATISVLPPLLLVLGFMRLLTRVTSVHV